MILAQLTINSLIAGAIYALVACGFSLIYSTNKFVHFAHGAVMGLSAYMLYLFFDNWGINFYVACVLTIIFSIILGIVMYRIYDILVKRKASNSIILIASVSFLIIIENIILILFGADVKTLAFIKVKEGLLLFGGRITELQIVIIVVSLILFVALYLFRKTKIGVAMRAVADNRDLAEISGINSKKIFYWSFGIGSALAGIAAIFVSLEQNIEPMMSTYLMIKAFTASIIGGIGSVPGAILGAFILGFVENFGIWYLPSGYKDAIAFGLLFLFLLFRPQGILGKKGDNK